MECEFTLRDAMNGNLEFLKRMITELQDVGVDVINIADSYTSVPISIHFHNDLDLATLNQLYSVQTKLDLKQLHKVAMFIANHYGIAIPYNKCITGRNCFLYEVGPYIHSSEDEIIEFGPFESKIIGSDRVIKSKGF